MTVNYTTNLSLGLPVTGTESGTWGDDVNNAITAYLDISIAGGLSVTITTTDVTLTLTQGTSSATNIGSTTAQYAILNVSGAMTAARNLILPSSSRVYVINNNTTGGFALTVKGSATSGVTMVNGEKAHVFWNGSDYAKVANTAGVATFTDLTYTGTLTGSTGVIAIGTNQIYKDSSGNVGIGTSSPAVKLDVKNGTAVSTITSYFTSGNSDPNFRLGFANGSGAAINTEQSSLVFTYVGSDVLAKIGFLRANASNCLGITFNIGGTGASTERMRIDSSGNVGIGVTPSAWAANHYALQITTAGVSVWADDSQGAWIGTNLYASASGTYAYQSSAYAGAYRIARTSGNHYWYTAPSGTAGTTATLTGAMVLDSSGNVGIGGVPDNSYPARLNLIASADCTLRLTKTAVVATSIKAVTTAMTFGVDGAAGDTERMRIDSSGNVGIGATTARAKLDVADNGAGLLTTGLHLGYSAANFYGFRVVNTNDASLTYAGLFKIQRGNGSSWVDDVTVSNTGIVTMSAYGVGTATFSAAGVISSVSDETWKIKDGIPVDPDSMLKKLEPCYWYYNDEKKETFGSERQLGFYAQNVNAAIGPEAAPTPEEGKPWGYYDRSVLAVTVMSLQKALATIESLTARIEALEAR